MPFTVSIYTVYTVSICQKYSFLFLTIYGIKTDNCISYILQAMNLVK